MALLKPGLDWLEAKTGKPVLAVLPYMHDLFLEAEDALSTRHAQQGQSEAFHIVVPRLPSFSNHTDFDALQLHPGVKVSFVKSPEQINGADLIILPGSKAVQNDLSHLKQQGWETYIHRHLRYGGKLLGICGGFQMLGKAIHDPHALESPSGSIKGLGFLDMETTLQEHKVLRQVTGYFFRHNTPVSGYEIHMGITSGPALLEPMFKLGKEFDGAVSIDNTPL